MSSPEQESSSSASPGHRPTPMVPDYELLRRVGRGAYGEVWLARNALGTLRAVKIIYRDAFESDRPYLREFAGIREFEPVSAHSSQVRVYHVGRNDEAGHFYYVMDLADDASSSAGGLTGCASSRLNNPDPMQRGKDTAPGMVDRGWDASDYTPDTLDSRLRRGRLPVVECLPIAIALASALRHLHEHGLVHRDIKPTNIIFVGGQPKLADIGLIASATSANTLVGTTGYIPIEGPGKPQADIFSFGKVLYEMATGCDRQDFPRLPEDFASLPDREVLMELNEVILKCCQSDAARRYAGVAELLADLERMQRGQSLRQRRRRKRLMVTAGAGLTAVGILVLWREILPGRMTSKPVEAEGKPLITNPVGRPGCVPAPPGLIAWWPGDGNANDIIGNHNGAPVNGADYATGLIGQAFRVNGTNQYFSIAHTPELSFETGDRFSLEAWVYWTGAGGDAAHVLGKRDTAFGCFYQMALGAPAPRNAWTHVVVTYEGRTESAYVNGAVYSVSERCCGPNSGNFHIGCSYFYFGFEGLIDDVRIYNRVLAQSEIKAIYGAGSNGMCLPPAQRLEMKDLGTPGGTSNSTGLVAWWPGDGDALDHAGIHNGILVNGTAFGKGRLGQAFTLNGYSAYVQAPDSSLWSFGSNSFTIELWARFANASGGQALVACDEGGGDLNKWIFWFNHGGIGLHVNRSNLNGSDIGYAPFTPGLNQWYHLAITRRSTEYVCFINGAAVSTNRERHDIPNLRAPLTIGAAEGGNFFNGSIDEVRVYNRALSAPEIAASCSSGTVGPAGSGRQRE